MEHSSKEGTVITQASFSNVFFFILIVFGNLFLIILRKQLPKAVVWRCSVEKLILKISQYSQENTCVESLLIKVAGLTSFWCFYCYLWTYFTPFSSVFIDDFEQVYVSWEMPHTHFLKFAKRKSSINIAASKHGLNKVWSKFQASKLQAPRNSRM